MSSATEGMTSNRPYLLRALYEWITDNGLTPHVLVDAEFDGVDVPDHAIQKGKSRSEYCHRCHRKSAVRERDHLLQSQVFRKALSISRADGCSHRHICP